MTKAAILGDWAASRCDALPQAREGSARSKPFKTSKEAEEVTSRAFSEENATRPACAFRSSKSPRGAGLSGRYLPLPLAGEGPGFGRVPARNTERIDLPHPPRCRAPSTPASGEVEMVRKTRSVTHWEQLAGG